VPKLLLENCNKNLLCTCGSSVITAQYTFRGITSTKIGGLKMRTKNIHSACFMLYCKIYWLNFRVLHFQPCNLVRQFQVLHIPVIVFFGLSFSSPANSVPPQDNFLHKLLAVRDHFFIAVFGQCKTLPAYFLALNVMSHIKHAYVLKQKTQNSHKQKCKILHKTSTIKTVINRQQLTNHNKIMNNKK